MLEGYEKVRTVGKGAFGTAVLYRREATQTLVVIKEINMMDITAAERQMALNEVQVLSSLHHPNIIRYLGSFEVSDTTATSRATYHLHIEMKTAGEFLLSVCCIAERRHRPSLLSRRST